MSSQYTIVVFYKFRNAGKWKNVSSIRKAREWLNKNEFGGWRYFNVYNARREYVGRVYPNKEPPARF